MINDFMEMVFKDSYYKTLLDVSMDNPSVAGVELDWRDERHTMLAAVDCQFLTFFDPFFTTCAVRTYCGCGLWFNYEPQEKIYREILQKVEDPSNVTHSDLRSLTYLEQSIMECLRLYPSVPIVLRKATKNTKLCK
ncbi:hypothetical protein J6590_082624 [Homalodisca vitripennis]|nr:hypothetical protein J6590_082624 [Homalodisca vitripennis]